MQNKKFKYIDLFAGIGGFHQAMEALGGECVLASEIDRYAIQTYYDNYGIDSAHDIKTLDINSSKDSISIPKHDVLCAGFPCQAFSKAGKQLGFKDETKGTLFFEIERILEKHHTKYIVLENVRNLVSHDHGHTWEVIYTHLKTLGYRLTPKPIILSPHHFGIPQLRERVVILGIYDPKNKDNDLDISFGKLNHKNDCSIDTILEKGKVDAKYDLTDYEIMVLNAWDEFYKGVKEKIIGFPIWSDYFKVKPDKDMPKWKQDFIMKNNLLYKNNKEFIDLWFKKYKNLKDFAPTHKKMEWQAGTQIESVWEGIIQFRTSGVRIKSPNCFPALVAMVHVPIIGPKRRKLTVREAANLQSFKSNFIPNESEQQAYKQFGNAVNVEVIKRSVEKLFEIK